MPVLQIDALNSPELTVEGRRFSRCDPPVGEYGVHGVGGGGWVDDSSRSSGHSRMFVITFTNVKAGQKQTDKK